MKLVVQRVSRANVSVDGNICGEIKKGYMILVGVVEWDTLDDVDILARKVANLRIFEDENGKMNLDIKQVDGEILAISQFTLCADLRKGNRPSFVDSAEPTLANEYYEIFCQKLLENGVKNVEKGIFGADMKVDLVNDGPVTIIYDSEIWRKK